MDQPQTGAAVDQSLALLEAVLAHGPAGFGYLDLQFRFVRLNAQLAQINGLPVEAHLGHTVAELLGPARWAERRVFLEKARAGEASMNVPLPGIVSPKTGTERHVVSSYLPITTAGVVAGVVVVVRDVTEQVEAERALRVSETRKATILEVALDCIITIDAEGRIVEFNPAAEQTFGYTRQEILGRVMAEMIVPPALRPRHYAGFAHYLATGEGPILRQRIEIAAVRANGEEFPVEIAIIPIHDGRQVLFTAYLRDISERRREEAERERLLREVAAAAERQRAFLRDVLASVTEGRLLPVPPA